VAWLRLWASRDFTASAPNVKYVGDITYLPLATGTNLYLATVIDCCSRRVAGWAIAEHMRTELVADALKAAAALRGTLAGAIFHSDHGSTPQGISRNSAKNWASLNPWVASGRAPIRAWFHSAPPGVGWVGTRFLSGLPCRAVRRGSPGAGGS
jgi:transposase InsO family protein